MVLPTDLVTVGVPLMPAELPIFGNACFLVGLRSVPLALASVRLLPFSRALTNIRPSFGLPLWLGLALLLGIGPWAELR